MHIHYILESINITSTSYTYEMTFEIIFQILLYNVISYLLY